MVATLSSFSRFVPFLSCKSVVSHCSKGPSLHVVPESIVVSSGFYIASCVPMQVGVLAFTPLLTCMQEMEKYLHKDWGQRCSLGCSVAPERPVTCRASTRLPLDCLSDLPGEAALSQPRGIHLWTDHGAWLLIYVDYLDAQWHVGKVPSGVYPLKRKSGTWNVEKHTGIEARRTGFWILPDFGSTAHSHGTRGNGSPASRWHPDTRLLRKLSDEITAGEAIREWNMDKEESSAVSLFLCTPGNAERPNRLLRGLSDEKNGSPASRWHPDTRLLRKLSDEIISDEAIKEWKMDKKKSSAVPLFLFTPGDAEGAPRTHGYS